MSLDKFGTLHLRVEKDDESVRLNDMRNVIAEAMSDVRMGKFKAISVSFPADGYMAQVFLTLPNTFPCDPFRDVQKGRICFVYDPANNIPRGGNADLGATALVVDVSDPDDTRILVVTNARNGRLQLPGGRADGTETPYETAAREAFEESGVRLDVKTGEIVSIQRFPTNQFVQGINIVVRWIVSDGTAKSWTLHADGKETSAVNWLPLSACQDIVPHISDAMLFGMGWMCVQDKTWMQNYGN